MNNAINFLGKQWPKRLFTCYMWWLVSLVAPLLVTIFSIKPYWRSADVIHTLLVVGCITVLSTLIFGYYLGKCHFQKYLVVAILSGTASLMLCYVVAMVVLNPNDPESSNAAGAGFAVLVVPVALVLSIIVLIGFGAGALRARMTKTR